MDLAVAPPDAADAAAGFQKNGLKRLFTGSARQQKALQLPLLLTAIHSLAISFNTASGGARIDSTSAVRSLKRQPPSAPRTNLST